MRQSFDEKRGRRIESYMLLVIAETRDSFESENTWVRKLDGMLVDETEAKGKGATATGEDRVKMESDRRTADGVMELSLLEEWERMEMLLVYEADKWEGQLWDATRGFICSDEVQEKERVEREWKANCWKRLDANIRAMDARMEAAQANAKVASNNLSREWRDALERIQRTWRRVIGRFNSFHRSRDLSRFDPERFTQDDATRSIYPHLSQLSNQRDKIEDRLRKELEDVEFQLEQGLKKCNEFWVDEVLLQCKHSRTKWLSAQFRRAPLEAYSRTLKTRDDVIYVDFHGCDYDWAADTIRNMPHLTSVFTNSKHLGDIERDIPLFINTFGAEGTDIVTFLQHNKLRFAETHRTFIYIDNMCGSHGSGPGFYAAVPTQLGLNESATIAISYFGPTSGSLTLRLRHCVSNPCFTFVVDDMTGSPAVEFPVPSMPSIDDITLQPRPAPSRRISFEPGARNNLIVRVQVSLEVDYGLVVLISMVSIYDNV
jgi:hypothetical protein